MAPETKRPGVRQLFVERMKRDGREKEWYALVKQVMLETGKGFGRSCWEAMRRGTSPQTGIARVGSIRDRLFAKL